MANKNTESSNTQVQVQQQQQQQQQYDQGEACELPPPPQSGMADARNRGASNTVFKSGPLYISSKGIGWTSWKKRWFILTRTSLVFFRSDPSAVPQKGSEVNLTLGGIDLNNSGSVVVKADKKLLTVLFPDGRDGRAFTLKAETNEDLQEWKAALENALAQAPSASHVMGQNGILRNDHGDATTNGSDESKNDQATARSMVLGRPILLALEDVDGTPSFLEKALKFVEDHGVKVEGILRQAAAVDDVEHRIREYEQGKTDFLAGEDAHVIADCVKYFLRELPSSPVPASCCNALLEACRTDRSNRVNAMRASICETFPEPNRRLLQRILMMMQTVASHKNVNRMSTAAVAACMAPLLLRPLLAGDCEIENDFDVGGDGSMQLLQAAAAANHAQAIVITLLEEYDNIFGEGSLSPDLYSDSEESGSGTEEESDGEEYDDDDASRGSYYTEDDDDNEYDDDDDDEEEDGEEDDDASNGSHGESATSSENDVVERDPNDHKTSDDISSEPRTPEESSKPKVTKKLLSGGRRSSLSQHNEAKTSENVLVKSGDDSETKSDEDASTKFNKNMEHMGSASDVQRRSTLSNAPGGSRRLWGRTPGKKNLSMESIDFSVEEEEDAEIERLESTKLELQNRISDEVRNNAVLQASLERRKKALYARRLALENDVARLQEKLQQERDRKTGLEAGLNMSKGNLHIPDTIDEKLKRDVLDVAQAETDIVKLERQVDNLESKLGQQEGRSSSSRKDKQKDIDAGTSHVSDRSAPQDAHGGARESELERLQDPASSHSRSLQPNQQQGTPRSNSKFVSLSKKSGSRGEGSTTSALSKLTTRLNFLKERRSQIANELQNMDKGRSSGAFSQSSEKGASDTPKSLQEPDRATNMDSDGSRLQSPHLLDRGRSENSLSFTGDGDRDRDRDRGRGHGINPNSSTSRTLSR